MAARNYSNTAVVTTETGLTTGAGTTLTLGSATGWPAAPFTAVVEPGNGNAEVILVGARSGTSCSSITRGYDGTAPVTHASGSTIAHEITAVDPAEANAHVNASAAVHGLAGTVIGTTDTQTLTNKTLAMASNTVTAPSCGLFLSANAVTGTGWNKTAYSGADEWDNANMHDPVTNNSRITFPVAGIYLIVAKYIINTGIQNGVQIRFNGAAAPTGTNDRYGASSAAGTSWVTPSTLTDMFQVAANDYVEMYTANSTSSTAASMFIFRATMLSS